MGRERRPVREEPVSDNPVLRPYGAFGFLHVYNRRYGLRLTVMERIMRSYAGGPQNARMKLITAAAGVVTLALLIAANELTAPLLQAQALAGQTAVAGTPSVPQWRSARQV